MKKQSLLFWDLLAKRYSKQPIADQAAYEKKLEVTRSYLTPESEVFEFGCGTGSTALTHAPYVKHILATDGSAKMINIAQEKADKAHIENVTFETTTIDAFAPAKASYDVVLGMSILHLLTDKEAAIAKVHDMLKPGGVFISSTVCIGNPPFYAKAIAKLGGIFGLTLRLFTEEALIKNLTDAGFTIDYRWKPESDEIRAVFVVAKKVKHL